MNGPQTNSNVEKTIEELKKVLRKQHLTYSQARKALNEVIWLLADEADRRIISQAATSPDHSDSRRRQGLL